MFKYATLIAVAAAASTVSDDATKAKDDIKSDATKANDDVKVESAKAKADAKKVEAKLKKDESNMKHTYLASSAHADASLSTLSKSIADKSTQADITKANDVASTDAHTDDCTYCLFAGGDYTAPIAEVKAHAKVDYVKAVAGVAAVAKVDAVAEVTKDGKVTTKAVVGVKAVTKVDAVVGVKAAAAVTAVDAKNGSCVFGGKGFAATSKATTDVVTRWADLTNEAMFAGLHTCNAGMSMNGASSYDADTDMGKAATFDKTSGLGATWDMSWGADALVKGDWAYVRTAMPSSFDGGLLMSVVSDASTTYTLKINGVADRYFNDQTVSSASLGKTGKVVLSKVDDISMFATTSAAADAGKDTFKVNFERISNEAMAKMVLEHGGVIVWVVIGCVLLCLIVVGVIFWKKCSKKEEFYNADDLYARV